MTSNFFQRSGQIIIAISINVVLLIVYDHFVVRKLISDTENLGRIRIAQQSAEKNEAFVPIPVGCATDSQTFCSGLSAGLLDACLQDNFEKVTKDCRKDLQKTRDSFAVCEKEITKFCSPPKYGGGRMVNCLKAYLSKLSESCAKRVDSNGR